MKITRRIKYTIEIECPREEYEKALDYCRTRYRIVRSGAFPTGIRTVDPTRLLIVAESNWESADPPTIEIDADPYSREECPFNYCDAPNICKKGGYCHYKD